MSKSRAELEELEMTLQTAIGELYGQDKGMSWPQYRHLKRYLILAGVAMEGALSESKMIRMKLGQIEDKLKEMTIGS